MFMLRLVDSQRARLVYGNALKGDLNVKISMGAVLYTIVSSVWLGHILVVESTSTAVLPHPTTSCGVF